MTTEVYTTLEVPPGQPSPLTDLEHWQQALCDFLGDLDDLGRRFNGLCDLPDGDSAYKLDLLLDTLRLLQVDAPNTNLASHLDAAKRVAYGLTEWAGVFENKLARLLLDISSEVGRLLAEADDPRVVSPAWFPAGAVQQRWAGNTHLVFADLTRLPADHRLRSIPRERLYQHRYLVLGLCRRIPYTPDNNDGYAPLGWYDLDAALSLTESWEQPRRQEEAERRRVQEQELQRQHNLWLQTPEGKAALLEQRLRAVESKLSESDR